MNISLEPEDTLFTPNTYGTGGGKNEEEFDLLSEIINDINNIYGKVPEGNGRKFQEITTKHGE